MGARLLLLASALLACCGAPSGRRSAGAEIPETPRREGGGGDPSAAASAIEATPAPICGFGDDEIADAVADGWMRASSKGQGCVECPDPAAFLSAAADDEDALEERISRSAAAMEKTRRLLGVDPAGDDDAPPAGLPDPDSLHRLIAREMEELRHMGDGDWSGLYPAVCLTSPAFRDAFAPFAARLLSNAKPGEPVKEAGAPDPDLAEAAVFLALQILDRRTLDTLVRFVRSGEDSDARETAVRHLCAFAMTDEVRAAIQWVIDHDPPFRSKAIKCLRKHATAQVGP
jgi:hypothetical protein